MKHEAICTSCQLKLVVKSMLSIFPVPHPPGVNSPKYQKLRTEAAASDKPLTSQYIRKESTFNFVAFQIEKSAFC